MGNESAVDRANKEEWEEREKWMMKVATEYTDKYYKEKQMQISTLIAPQDNSHDDSGIKDSCLEYITKTHRGVTFDVYVGGKGRYKNLGSRGFGNWTCYGSDHRQDDCVMVLGDKYGDEYLKQIDDEKKPDEFISINFDLKNGAVSGTKPQSVWKTSRENDGDLPQSWVISEEAEATHKSHFVARSGIQMKTGVKFQCGVPAVSSGEVSTELTSSMEMEAGQEETFKKTYKISVNNQVSPGTKLTVEAVVFKSMLDVPYELKFRRGGKEYCEKGVWKGVTTWELNIKDKAQPIKK